MRNQKGITLVALVVTIVVLLILAGVSIAMLSGDNGIITNAQDAAAANTEGEVIDRMNLAYSTVKTEIVAKSSVNEDYDAKEKMTALKALIDDELAGSGIVATVSGSTITMTYSDTKYFDGTPYQTITGTITVESNTATYDMPDRQVNSGS